MNVKVVSCWNGGHKHFYHLQRRDGQRITLSGVGLPWDRAAATKALNFIEQDWGVDRSKVRFVHV